MKMPLRANFNSGSDYLAAMDRWKLESDAAYHYLRGKYDAQESDAPRPDWTQRGSIKHVDIFLKVGESERNLEIILRALSGSAQEADQKIGRVWHGVIFDGASDGLRACYAECLSEAKVA